MSLSFQGQEIFCQSSANSAVGSISEARKLKSEEINFVPVTGEEAFCTVLYLINCSQLR